MKTYQVVISSLGGGYWTVKAKSKDHVEDLFNNLSLEQLRNICEDDMSYEIVSID